jgi:hypothetical protein
MFEWVVTRARPATAAASFRITSSVPDELYYEESAKSMGKRELLLIAGFIVFGGVLYQFTKPDTNPGQQGFSFSRLIESIRREVRGRHARAEVVTANTHSLKPSTNELRISIRTGQITVLGEDRTDMASEMKASSDGVDLTEAQSLAKQVLLLLGSTADTVEATLKFPDPGSQRATLVLRVPSRLKVRVEPNNGRLEIQNVAAAEVATARGETIVKGVSDRLTMTHRGGDLNIDDVGSIRLNTRGSDVKLSKVRGEAVLQLQAGELRAESLTGPIEIDSNDSDVTLEKLGDIKGVLRVNAVAGQLTMRDLRSEARVDGRGSEIDVRLDRPAALSIYNSNEPIEVTVPAGGFELDARVTDGQITIAPSLQSQIKVAAADPDKEQSATGKVNGGGPAITLRVTRGDIRVIAATESSS